MAGFILRKDPLNTDFEFVGMNSTTASVGDLFYLNIGTTYYTRCDNADVVQYWTRKAVAAEPVTLTMSFAKVTPVTTLQTWEAESANNSNAGHNGDRMILTDQNTVNNTGTDSTSDTALVIQVGTAGAASDKRILVKFTGDGGVNPDATA